MQRNGSLAKKSDMNEKEQEWCRLYTIPKGCYIFLDFFKLVKWNDKLFQIIINIIVVENCHKVTCPIQHTFTNK